MFSIYLASRSTPGAARKWPTDSTPRSRRHLSQSALRLNELTGKLADTRTELANVQDVADAAIARAVAAVEAEKGIRQADEARRARGRWGRLRAGGLAGE